jgi:hypothetical protein
MGTVICFDINANQFLRSPIHFSKSGYLEWQSFYENKCENVIILLRYFEMAEVQRALVNEIQKLEENF